MNKIEAVIKAAKKLCADQQRASQETFEKTVLGQTLETASKNWDTLDHSWIDFGPLIRALSELEN